MVTTPERRASRRRWWWAAGAVVALGVLGGGALALLLAGFLVNSYEVFPHRFFTKVENRLERMFVEPKGPEALASQVYPSALIRLQSEVVVVDTGRDPLAHPISQSGGGMTAFGDDVLLLPYSGRIFAAGGPDSVRETGLVAPDNNRAAYQAAARDPAFDNYDFSLDYLRYNDLEYFRTAEAHGLIASYSEYHPDRACTTNTLARLDFPPEAQSIDAVSAGPEDWRVIFRTEPCLPFKEYYLALEGHMASGKLAWDGASETLYLSSGDYHLDGMRSLGAPIAQDPEAQYGKILALSPDGTDVRQISMGHRNIQGVTLTPNGTLIATEHGPRGGDEINVIREGANYGWPLESYGTTYSSTSIPNALSYGRHESFTQPIFAWVPSVATSAIVELDGFHPDWDGDLLVGTLIDQALYRVRRQDGLGVYAERIPIGTRIREMHLTDDGRVVLWSDNQEMIFLSPLELENAEERFEKFVQDFRLEEAHAAALGTVVARCAECHSFAVNDHARSPSLAKIFAAPIASTSYEGYSDALQAADGTWTRDNLAAFLDDPGAFAPGTAMPDPGITDPAVLASLIDYLEDLQVDF